ncbi:MarR family winged helix-turn-helix transcriptional regulator [Actinomadura latina]|uniref:Winged helix DNA-binding protein n=1 Tax=Actinomadura latina TaxID=163603 RepID=A0A846YTL6_9ACTN|nr:MarR family transcriptional regulator [Actinomadura latina]NKZ03087.1 winged helix DNA-binding protein [Actinomadura latina]
MVVNSRPGDLELSLLALFAGWAMADRIQRRLAAEGFADLRFNDGVVIQHVVAGPLSITALAERMGVTQQAASKAVADLEARGVLARRRSAEDARAKLLHLTEHGQAAVRAARTLRAELDAELAARFGAERIAETRGLLAEILLRFDADDAIRRRRVRPPL